MADLVLEKLREHVEARVGPHDMQAHCYSDVMSALQASKICSPNSPGMATSAKSNTFADSRAAVSSASNCRCDRPSGRDSGGHDGSADVVGRGAFQDRVDET